MKIAGKMKTPIWPMKLFLIIAILLATGFGFYRLRFGIDFLDEAFYLALPHEFLSGARPFVQEYALQQTAGFILVPFVSVYAYFMGNFGTIFFARILYFLFSILMGSLVATVIADSASWILALSISAMTWLYWPFAIPSASYNTLGSLFLLLGVFATAGSFSRVGGHFRRRQIVGGISLGLSVLAYPTMLLPEFVLYVVLLITGKSTLRARLSDLRYLLAAHLSVGCFIFGLLTVLGWDHILYAVALHKSNGVQGPSWIKFVQLFSSFVHDSGWSPRAFVATILVACGFALIARKFSGNKIESSPVWARSICSLLPAALIPFICRGQISEGPLFFPTYLAVLGAIFFLSRKEDSHTKRFFLIIWLPSMLAGLTTAMTSSNGFPNAMIGCLPAAILGIFWAARASDVFPNVMVARILQCLIVALPMFTCYHFARNSIYGEGYDMTQLKWKVKTGPYAGMWSSQKKVAFIEQLQSDLDRYSQNEKSILCYDNFQAGYLFTDLTPVGPGISLYRDKVPRPEVREAYARYFKALPDTDKPDVVVELKDSRWDFYEGNQVIEPERLTNFFKNLGYSLAQEREQYWIWVKPPSAKDLGG